MLAGVDQERFLAHRRQRPVSDRLDPEIKAFRDWLTARLISQRFWQDEIERQRVIKEQVPEGKLPGEKKNT
jgi:hypothetical protein